MDTNFFVVQASPNIWQRFFSTPVCYTIPSIMTSSVMYVEDVLHPWVFRCHCKRAMFSPEPILASGLSFFLLRTTLGS